MQVRQAKVNAFPLAEFILSEAEGLGDDVREPLKGMMNEGEIKIMEDT